MRLPIRFSAEAVQQELRALPQSSWVPHPNLIPGNDAVRLVTTDGMDTDELDGRMAPTRDLKACPNIVRIMEVLDGTWGRSRVMGLAAGASVPPHVDTAYYWRTHLRIHIPIITNPGVAFTCGGNTVHMEAGECWIFDSFQPHEVHNRGDQHRAHLVLDTVGGGRLWDLVEAASQGNDQPAEVIPPGNGDLGKLAFEQVNSPKVMTPWELLVHFDFLLQRARPHPLLDQLSQRLDRLTFEWAGVWAAYGDSDEGVPRYRALLAGIGRDLTTLQGQTITLQSGLAFYHVLGRMVLSVAVANDPSPGQGSVTAQNERVA